MFQKPATRQWLNRTVWGIVVATFFSDVSHEMATAVLPDFIKSVGLGPLALGLIEGLADFLVSISKLGGGLLGHYVRHKKPWTALGYLITTVCTTAIGFTKTLTAMITLRTVAWAGRGYRSPLRDFLLADAVEQTHYGRAYGLERAGDMLGATVGPLLAAAMVWWHVDPSIIIKWGLVPGILAAASIYFVAKERDETSAQTEKKLAEQADIADSKRIQWQKFPRLYLLILVGVLLFGIGDFSRTFLVWLAAMAMNTGAAARGSTTTASAALTGATILHFAALPMLLYAMHNAVSAVVAYPVGHLGDRRAKLPLLVGGYTLGVATNALLAMENGSMAWLSLVFVLSGTYIAVEETLEKAVVADLLPREMRSLGLGILACANAVGDMVSSLYVGFLLRQGRPQWAFGIAAAAGAAGVAWLLCLLPRTERALRSSP
ncbi:MAG TPA: MFS transporter [Pirellulales bacterium]|jgi:MFS family permease|nr:MFS transporter [Pirellulales bacterium]